MGRANERRGWMALWREVLIAAHITLLGAYSLAAQSVGAVDSLPSARTIVERYVQAVGGADALLRHTSMRLIGTFEMPANNVKGALEIVRAKPNLFAMKVTLVGIGDVAAGYNGAVGWSIDPVQGERLLAGAELAQRGESAEFADLVRSNPSIVTMETVGQTDFNGERCYQVKIDWKSGRTSIDYYSVASHLLIGTSGKIATAMGEFDVRTVLSDYTDYDGFKMPARMAQEAFGVQQRITIASVEYDTADSTAFAMPQAIKALVSAQTPADSTLR